MKAPVVRFAPSPTGIPHVGNIRAAIFNWLFARANNGRLILRIEDTDRKRFVPGSLEKILEILKFLGIDWDEGPRKGGRHKPYVQSERLDIYREHVKRLLESGDAYYCFCSPSRLKKLRRDQRDNKRVPKYDRHCLNLDKGERDKKLAEGLAPVVRLRVPENRDIVWNDLVQGKIKINTSAFDDQVLLKSDGYPTYHLAVVVDDHLMGISHVLRGPEWISSTPKHLLLYEAFGWKAPKFAHIPLVLGPDKTKLSKRHGARSVLDYRDEGYLPEGLINFLVLLGWHPRDDQEILSIKELIKKFDLKRIRSSPAVFDQKKLDYFNGYYIRQKSDKRLAGLLKKFIPELNGRQRLALAPLVKDRIKTLAEARRMSLFLFKNVKYPRGLLLQRGASAKEAKVMIKEALKVVESVDKLEDIEKIRKGLMKLIKDQGWQTGRFFMVFRVALSGQKITPPIIESLPILGKRKALVRLKKAMDKL